MQELKFLKSTGFNILINEDLDIQADGYWIYNHPTVHNIITKNVLPQDWFDKLHDKALYKNVLFADPSLNLDLPPIPDWEEWEIEQKAESFSVGFPITSKSECGEAYRLGLNDGYIEGYKAKTAEFTREDMIDALFFALNKEKETCCVTHTKDAIVREAIQSLEKTPTKLILNDKNEIQEVIY